MRRSPRAWDVAHTHTHCVAAGRSYRAAATGARDGVVIRTHSSRPQISTNTAIPATGEAPSGAIIRAEFRTAASRHASVLSRPGGISMIRRWRSIPLAAALAAISVALLSAQRTVPTPAAVLGWEPCADYKLATYEQIEDYFRKVAAAAAGRMQLVEMGKTSEGRTQVLAIVSSEENIRQLGRYKDIARKLALAKDGTRPLAEEDARRLARE